MIFVSLLRLYHFYRLFTANPLFEEVMSVRLNAMNGWNDIYLD